MKQDETEKSTLSEIISAMQGIVSSIEDQRLISPSLKALNGKYDLSWKIRQEPGLKEIIQQFLGRIYQAYGTFSALKGLRILDIACGSNTSKAPSFVFIDTPFGEHRIPIPHNEGYTAQFEPWFCRVLVELGADTVGVDLGNLDGELFEHYNIDLGQPGALNFLTDHSFDGVQDSRLFGSPEFTAQFPNRADRLKVAAEIWKQEQRLLTTDGVVIHSDAVNLLK